MKPELVVIGIAGQKRSGKDETSNYLADRLFYTDKENEQWGWGRASFASAVKKIFCDTFDFPLEDIDEWKVKPEPPPGFNKPLREGLTFIGNGFREIMSNIWIERAFQGDWEHKIISDLRYINEARKIKSVDGFTVLLHRTGNVNYDKNESEAQIRPYVLWCYSTGREGVIKEWPEYKALVEFSKESDHCTIMPPYQLYNNQLYYYDEQVPTVPEFVDNLSQFDMFIDNDGNLEQLLEKVDNMIIPTLKTLYDGVLSSEEIES